MMNSYKVGPRVRSRSAFKLVATSTLVFAALSLSGCKDKKKCDEAVQTTRQAVQVEDTALARQWRDRTWKMCGDADQLKTLDQEIVAKEEEIAKRAVDAAKAAREAAEAKLAELERLWLGVDKLDAFQKTGKKFEREKVEAEIRHALNEGKRGIAELQEVYAKQLADFHKQQYRIRMRRADEQAKKK